MSYIVNGTRLTDKEYAEFCEANREKYAGRLQEMLASRGVPEAMTDREFTEGRGPLAKQFEGAEDQLEKVIAAARAQGYEPNPNDIYLPCLAERLGDPLAFCPPTGYRGHIRKVLEMRNWAGEGSVNHVPYEEDPAAPVALATDLIEEEIDRIIQENPDLARIDRRDLASEITYRHGNPKLRN